MKYLITGILTAFILVLAAGCGNDAAEDANEAAEEAIEAANEAAEEAIEAAEEATEEALEQAEDPSMSSIDSHLTVPEGDL